MGERSAGGKPRIHKFNYFLKKKKVMIIKFASEQVKNTTLTKKQKQKSKIKKKNIKFKINKKSKKKKKKHKNHQNQGTLERFLISKDLTVHVMIK